MFDNHTKAPRILGIGPSSSRASALAASRDALARRLGRRARRVSPPARVRPRRVASPLFSRRCYFLVGVGGGSPSPLASVVSASGSSRSPGIALAAPPRTPRTTRGAPKPPRFALPRPVRFMGGAGDVTGPIDGVG